MSSVLIEELGPRGRRRALVGSVVSTALILAGLAFLLYRFQQFGVLDADQWQPFTARVNLGFLFEGLLNTIKAAVTAAVLSIAAGFLLALGRLARTAPVRWACRLYVELFRSVPLLIMIFAAFFGLPELGVDVSRYTALVVALMIYNSAVLAEIFRAGILSLDKGQTEAAQAIGLRYWQQMRIVILPQAVRRMIPAIVAQLATITKDTALGFIILYPELLYQARFLGSQNQLGSPILPVALVIAVIYIGLCLILTGISRLVERRLSQGPRSGGAKPADPELTAPQVPSGAGYGGGAA